MQIITESAKLLAKETLGLDIKVDLLTASFLILKRQLENGKKMCKV